VPESEAKRATRILIIDDEREIREMLRDMLRTQGYEVMTAADGHAGTRLQRQHPADLVITDIFMPEKEGIETILDLQTASPGLKIIAISGGGGDYNVDYLAAARQLGAIRSISKPFDLDDLLATVRDALAS
jgi:DNA-binding NtrC family response regulator